MKIFTRTAVLSFGFAVAMGAAAEASPLASDRDMVTGVSVTEADCKAQTGRLWVRVENRGFCVRFWLSTAGGSKDEALVAFHGDIGGKIDGKLQLAEQVRSISDESLQKAADYRSRLYRGVYLFIARPGAFGSSGHHVKDRRTLLEIRIAMAALDVLKRQNGFTRFHLVGQSGGGHTVAGLVQLRSDIGCAVITSGVTSVRSMQRDIGRPIVGRHRFYDPIDHVNTIRQRPGLRLFVVSDHNDKVVSYRSQLEFVERIKAHNLPITHVTAMATDKNSHDLFDHGLRVAADCANKARDQDLVTANEVRPKPVHTRRIIELPATEAPRAADPSQANREVERARTAQTTVPPGFDAVPRPPGQVGGQGFMPPGPSSGVLAPSNPNPLQLAPSASQPVSRPPPAAPSWNARVVLYAEDPADPQGNRYVGSAIWRTETVTPGPGETADLAVLADVEIPDLRITMTFTLRRNRDKALPASHTIEVKFNLPADFAFGGISNVPGILMKQAEQTRGAPLAGLAVKVTSGFFLVGLSAVEADMQRNLQLLKERAWFDVPIVYNNGRRAILALEKGNPGERALEEALKAWEQTSADLAPSSGVLAPSPGVANPNPLLVPQAAQPAADPSQAELAWAATKDTITIAVLEEFVRRYGDSHYAALARARMEELRKSQAAAPPLVPPQPLVAAFNEPKRVKTVTIRTEVASRPPATAFGPPAVVLAGAYLVQVSAQKSEAEAQSSYRILQQKYPSVLGGREPTIRRAEIGQNSVWYRVHVGSFATSEQATAFCDNLKAAGGQCIVQREDWGGAGPGEPPAASLRGGRAIEENSEAMKYENKKTTPVAAEPPLNAADTLTRGVTIDERGCKARFQGLASEGLRLAADCAKEGDDAAPTARQTETPPSARGREVPAVRPQPVSVEPRERERKAAKPRRASVERRRARVPRQAKPRGSVGRCFVIGGRSFCE